MLLCSEKLENIVTERRKGLNWKCNLDDPLVKAFETINLK